MSESAQLKVRVSATDYLEWNSSLGWLYVSKGSNLGYYGPDNLTLENTSITSSVAGRLTARNMVHAWMNVQMDSPYSVNRAYNCTRVWNAGGMGESYFDITLNVAMADGDYVVLADCFQAGYQARAFNQVASGFELFKIDAGTGVAEDIEFAAGASNYVWFIVLGVQG